MPDRSILSVLIAIAYGESENPQRFTEDMHALIRDALMMHQDAAALLPRLRDIKGQLLPDCAHCPHPCGRSEDFDFALLALETPAACAFKEQLINALPRIAREKPQLLLPALRAVGEYRRDENLPALAEKFL